MINIKKIMFSSDNDKMKMTVYIVYFIHDYRYTSDKTLYPSKLSLMQQAKARQPEIKYMYLHIMKPLKWLKLT